MRCGVEWWHARDVPATLASLLLPNDSAVDGADICVAPGCVLTSNGLPATITDKPMAFMANCCWSKETFDRNELLLFRRVTIK